MLEPRCYTWPDWTLTLVLTDSTRLIEYLTGHILYYVLSTLLFIYFIHVISYSSIYIFVICSYVICIFTFQFILIHSLKFWLPGFVYPDPWLFIVDQVFREDHMHLEKLEFLSSWLSVFLLFCSCYFRILSISHPVTISFLYSSAIIVLDIYMSHCSNIDLSQ